MFTSMGVPELIFTFGLFFVIEESVQYIWGRNMVPYNSPESLNFIAINLAEDQYRL